VSNVNPARVLASSLKFFIPKENFFFGGDQDLTSFLLAFVVEIAER
jgi:hypothetical protein